MSGIFFTRGTAGRSASNAIGICDLCLEQRYPEVGACPTSAVLRLDLSSENAAANFTNTCIGLSARQDCGVSGLIDLVDATQRCALAPRLRYCA